VVLSLPSQLLLLSKCWTILFLVAVAAQTFSKGVVVLYFNMNQQVIAATLCENRAKPRSSCNGKCHLKKQLAQEEEQQNSPYSSGSKEKFEVLLYAEPKNDAARDHKGTVIPRQFPPYSAPLSAGMLPGVFHPPQA
jgi:hypothetical protein